MIIEVTPKCIQINTFAFSTPQFGSAFAEVLGTPSRVVALGDPAPFGHRNNHALFYDDVGLYLLEHHATRLIQAIVFVFAHEHAILRPLRDFRDTVSLFGVAVEHPMLAREFAAKCPRPFEGVLGSIYVDCEFGTVVLPTYAERTRSGRTSSRRYITEVSVGFEGSHIEGKERGERKEERKGTQLFD